MKYQIIINRYNPIRRWGLCLFEDYGYAISLFSIYLGNHKVFIGTKYKVI